MKGDDLIRQSRLFLYVLKNLDGNSPDLSVLCLVLQRRPPQHDSGPDGLLPADVFQFRIREHQTFVSGKILLVQFRGQVRIGGGDDLHRLIERSRHLLIPLRHSEIKGPGIKPGNYAQFTVPQGDIHPQHRIHVSGLQLFQRFFSRTAQNLIHMKSVHLRKRI